MKNGKLIVIDGADGSGKATQSRILVERLNKEGVQAELLDFPRYKDNTIGSLIRECLDGKRGDFMDTDPRIASVLYAADRYESRPRILKWLEEGKVVILDRYVSANMLHQGAKIDDDVEAENFLKWLDHVEHTVFDLPRPDSIFYLEVPHIMRQTLLKKDKSRTYDLAEINQAHQEACETRAKSIVSKDNEWSVIRCIKDEKLRSINDIHEELYSAVVELL